VCFEAAMDPDLLHKTAVHKMAREGIPKCGQLVFQRCENINLKKLQNV
jgi:hypothetical protein